MRIFGIFNGILIVESGAKSCVGCVVVCVGVRFCEGL